MSKVLGRRIEESLVYFVPLRIVYADRYLFHVVTSECDHDGIHSPLRNSSSMGQAHKMHYYLLGDLGTGSQLLHSSLWERERVSG